MHTPTNGPCSKKNNQVGLTYFTGSKSPAANISKWADLTAGYNWPDTIALSAILASKLSLVHLIHARSLQRLNVLVDHWWWQKFVMLTRPATLARSRRWHARSRTMPWSPRLIEK